MSATMSLCRGLHHQPEAARGGKPRQGFSDPTPKADRHSVRPLRRRFQPGAAQVRSIWADPRKGGRIGCGVAYGKCRRAGQWTRCIRTSEVINNSSVDIRSRISVSGLGCPYRKKSGRTADRSPVPRGHLSARSSKGDLTPPANIDVIGREVTFAAKRRAMCYH